MSLRITASEYFRMYGHMMIEVVINHRQSVISRDISLSDLLTNITSELFKISILFDEFISIIFRETTEPNLFIVSILDRRFIFSSYASAGVISICG